jgi:hypothetical protein
MLIAASIILFVQANTLAASPGKGIDELIPDNLKGWQICWDGKEQIVGSESTMTLACKPNVNVSLGQGGYAVLTALLLVNGPVYGANEYHVDIMGPLHDTVYCAQLGQHVMVVVTELPTGNSCMSDVYVEDKLKPVLVCTSDTLPCNVDIYKFLKTIGVM